MLVPSPSTGRGQVVLQPAYFTSSVFVCPARADINNLLHEYARRYAPSAPFALFKHVWRAQGWTWIHFLVLDSRARAAFLCVMLRLFLERTGVSDAPLNRAAALFGLYTTYYTQPSSPAPSLHHASRIQVTCAQFSELTMLPDALDGDVRPHVVHVLSKLVQACVFDVLAQLPPLPRQVVATQGRKKRGRPSKRERVMDLLALDTSAVDAGPTRGRYAAERSTLASSSAWRVATGAVTERMEMVKNSRQQK